MRRLMLAAAIAACGCASVGCSRRLPDFERMRQQQRTDPYEASAVFSDGMAMRVPPTATVPRDARDMPAAVATGLEGGAPVRDIPIPVTPGLVVLGQHHFEIFCAVCHGADGSGGAVMAANMPGKRPPSLLTPTAAAYPAGYLYDVISRGRNRMPAYDWAVPPAERWAVIAYVRALQRSTASPEGGSIR